MAHDSCKSRRITRVGWQISEACGVPGDMERMCVAAIQSCQFAKIICYGGKVLPIGEVAEIWGGSEVKGVGDIFIEQMMA